MIPPNSTTTSRPKPGNPNATAPNTDERSPKSVKPRTDLRVPAQLGGPVVPARPGSHTPAPTAAGPQVAPPVAREAATPVPDSQRDQVPESWLTRASALAIGQFRRIAEGLLQSQVLHRQPQSPSSQPGRTKPGARISTESSRPGDGSLPGTGSATLDLTDGAATRKTKRSIGGVAPAVHPPTTWDRIRQGRVLERKGFVPLSPGRSKRRHRILPRTAIGICFMLLSLGAGAAFAGASFYAYYDNRLAANEEEITQFVEGFDTQFVEASDSINQLRSDSLDQIRKELQPLDEYVSEQNGVVNLPAQVGASIFQLRTTDEAGRVVAGSAAAVASHRGGTALVTSYSLVKAGTISPGPGIELTKGDQKLSATLWSWDEERDLALVVIEEELPRLSFATDQDQTSMVGARVFAMSGTGGQGATASPGIVLDRSAAGLQHTAVIGSLFDGGPLVNSAGEIVGVASTRYSPLGIDGGDVHFAPDLAGVCAKLLNCADPVEPESIDTEPGG